MSGLLFSLSQWEMCCAPMNHSCRKYQRTIVLFQHPRLSAPNEFLIFNSNSARLLSCFYLSLQVIIQLITQITSSACGPPLPRPPSPFCLTPNSSILYSNWCSFVEVHFPEYCSVNHRRCHRRHCEHDILWSVSLETLHYIPLLETVQSTVTYRRL